MGSRHLRKIRKYSNNFNRMFSFFFLVNRKNLISFCGSIIDIEFDVNGVSGKECFRLYEDGHYKNRKIITKHPNLVKSILIGKKGWGLWLDQWTDGIVDWSFTKEEILSDFEKLNIEIPESFMKDFDNTIKRKSIKRNLEYLKTINKQ